MIGQQIRRGVPELMITGLGTNGGTKVELLRPVVSSRVALTEESPMIIFKKLPGGTWQKSGEILPTERYYAIAVDALNPERMALPCEQAIQEVENRIKAGTEAFRFELASPPASFHKAAREQAEKGIHKILRATTKAKMAKPSKRKKESGKQRRARLKREGLCTACGKRKPQKDRFECKTCADYYKKWAAKKAGK
jgi:hypothetical protein